MLFKSIPHKNEYSQRLLNYATSAGVFLALQPTLNAQVVYENIDPDVMLFPLTVDSLDLNHDDIYDIKFSLYQDSSVLWSTYESDFYFKKMKLTLSGFDAIMVDTGLETVYNLQELNNGDIINTDAAWNSGSTIPVTYIYTHANGDVDFIANWAGEDKIFGLRFQIDGEPHYGWVRLSIVKFVESAEAQRYFIVQDFAWELQPNTPIQVGATTTAPAQKITITDIGETGTAADLKLDFLGAADETGISAYRVYLFPYDYSYDPHKLSELLLLDETRYKTVTPGAVNNTVYFSDEDLTAEGLPITQSEVYYAVIVSMADGINAIHNNISIQSPIQYLGTLSAAPVNYINLQLTPILNNSSDFKVSFYEDDNSGVSEYRIFLFKEGDYLHPDSLLELNENYYTTVEPISNGYHHDINLNPDQLVVNFDTLEFFNYYYVAVASIANNVLASKSTVNYEEEELELYFVQVYPQEPIVTIENPAANTSNIRVQFPKSDFEEYLEYYKFMIAPATDTTYYNAANANTVTGLTKSLKFYPSGEDIDLNMYADMLDVHGNPIDSINEYVIYCLLYTNFTTPKIALSLPSTPFKLNKNFGIPPTNQIIFNNETLQINLISFDSFDFDVVNTSGQIVYKGITKGPNTEVDLSFLANGIYYVKVHGLLIDAVKMIIAGKK